MKNKIIFTAQFINPSTGEETTQTLDIMKDLSVSGEININYQAPVDGGPVLRPTNPPSNG
jgi:hypothetical protein